MTKLKEIIAQLILCIFGFMIAVLICIMPYAMFLHETGSHLTAAKYLAESILLMALVIGLLGWAIDTTDKARERKYYLKGEK